MKTRKNKWAIMATMMLTTTLVLVSCSDEVEQNQTDEIINSKESSQETSDKWGFEDNNSFNVDPAAASRAARSDVEWSYEGEEGPEFWGELSPDFLLCAEGLNQSPIDIPDEVDQVYGGGLWFNYRWSKLRVLNNTHTIEFSPMPGSFVVADYQRYDLLQFHVHATSEHTVDGESFPLELHFVHKNADNELLVVGVFVDEGDTNYNYRKFWKNFPTEGNTYVDVDQYINLRRLLPRNKTMYQYDGSLTTPPCSEGVKWNVLKRKIEMSEEQIETFTQVFDGNFRPVQDLNDRTVTKVRRYRGW